MARLEHRIKALELAQEEPIKPWRRIIQYVGQTLEDAIASSPEPIEPCDNLIVRQFVEPAPDGNRETHA